MTSLFANFNKTMGVDNKRIDAQQTETAVAIGNYTRDLTGGNSRPDAALKMQDGRHVASSTVLNQYAIAGQQVSPEINAMLEELDQLSIASQSVAGMDNQTRIRLIARGNHGVDPARIKQKEAELLSAIGDQTREVLTEKQRIDLNVSRENLTQERQDTERNELALRAGRRSEQTQAELQRYRDITEDMSFTEIQDAFNNEGIEGIPRVGLALLLNERAKLELELKTTQAALSPETTGLFGFGSNTTNTRSSGKGKSIDAQLNDAATSLSVEASPILLRQALEQRQEADALSLKNGGQINPSQVIEIPGINRPVAIATAQIALQQINERNTKFNETQAATFNAQAPLVTNLYNSTILTFGEKLKSQGIDINNPNNQIGRELGRQQDEYRLAMSSGDLGAAREAITNLRKKQDEIIEEIVDGDNVPELEKAFRSENATTGKGRNPASTVDMLASVSGNSLIVATRTNPAFKNLGDYTNATIAQGQRDFEADQNSEEARLNRIKEGGKIEKFEDRHIQDILERNFDSGTGSALMINSTANFIVNEELYGILQEAISNAEQTQDGPARNILEQTRRILFGDNHAARQLIGDEEGKFRLRRNIPFNAVGNDNQFESLQNDDGTPVTYNITDKQLLFEMLGPLSAKLEKQGIPINIGNELLTRLQSNAGNYADLLKPNNLEQKALFMSVSRNYMSNRYSNETDAMRIIVDSAIDGIRDSMIKGDTTLSDSQTIFSTMTREEREQWVFNRSNDILGEQGVPASDRNSTNRAAGFQGIKALGQARREFNDILSGTAENGEADLSLIVDSLFDN